MAATPLFATTPRIGAGIVPATADTSRTAPTNATTIVTGVAAGTKIERIVAHGLGTTVIGGLCFFLHDGTTYHLFDEWTVSAVTASTTVPPWRAEQQYLNLVLPSASWTLRVTTQHASNQSLVKVFAMGADLT